MKKFLLSLAAVALVAGSAIAEEVTIDMTKVVTENEWTSSAPLSGFTESDITFEFDTATGTNYPRVYLNAAGTIGGFQMYKGNTLSITVPSGNRIEAMKFTATTPSYYMNATCDLGAFTTTGMKTDYEWEAKDDVTNVVTFVGNGTIQIKTVVITYSEFSGKIPEKANLSFPEQEYVVTMGDEFPTPVLTKATTAPAAYTSSNPAVATVDAETGAITLVAPGSTVITATCEANEDYFGGTASYTLEVKKVQVIAVGQHNIICSIADKSGFTSTTATSSSGATVNMVDDGIEFTMSRGGYTNIYYYNATGDIWVPANSTVKVVAPEPYVLRSITFNLSAEGVKYQCELTASIGEMQPQTKGGDKIEWIGEDKEVTFTVSPKAVYSEAYSASAGKLCFSSVDVAYDIYTGVNEVETVKGEAKFFDLNGRQVAYPTNGIYVMIVDGKASKVVIK